MQYFITPKVQAPIIYQEICEHWKLSSLTTFLWSSAPSVLDSSNTNPYYLNLKHIPVASHLHWHHMLIFPSLLTPSPFPYLHWLSDPFSYTFNKMANHPSDPLPVHCRIPGFYVQKTRYNLLCFLYSENLSSIHSYLHFHLFFYPIHVHYEKPRGHDTPLFYITISSYKKRTYSHPVSFCS